MIKISLSLGLLLAAGSASWAAGDPGAGRVKSEACLGCHGIATYNNVYPTYHVPKLTGQHAEYIVAALQAYQGGQRKHPTMEAQAWGMSDQDMQDIAAYWASAGN
ncbi:MAG: c-type cytochrome [Gammaproteobacteria bacterium]|jgi:cytochrome c553